jgi:arginase
MYNFLNFSGIGIEIGQSKKGLTSSAEYARNYFSILKNAGFSVNDFGDVSLSPSVNTIKFFSEKDLKHFSWKDFQIAQSKCKTLLELNEPLINWGGDHSVAISTVSAFTTKYPHGHVIWIDAHADLNLPSKSLSGNLHGMPLSILCNLEDISKFHFKWIHNYLDPKKLIYVGLRDIDPFEMEMIEKLGITYFTSNEVKQVGMHVVAKKIKDIVKGTPVHISFDIDSVDPSLAPATGLHIPNGLSIEDLLILGQTCFHHFNLTSVDILEINPTLGTMLEIDQTYITAFYFLRSLFSHTQLGDNYESISKKLQTTNINEMEWGL